MANYKATFILDTREREEGADELIEGLKQDIASLGGEVSSAENLGKQDFAQAADRRYTSGTYAVFEFSGGSELPDQILEKLRLNSLVSHKMIQKI